MKDLTMEQMEKHIEAGDMFVIDFYADWCEKCVTMMPVVENIEQLYGDIPFYKVNVDNSPDIKEKARIKAIPMLTMYNNGHVRDFAFGITEESKITNKLDRVSQL